jgi:predicted AAA+ superfamily ATPase
MLLPLSFSEYMDFKGYDTDLNKSTTTRQLARVRSYLQDYLSQGSFPGLIAYPASRSRFYDDYVDLVLYRDLIERYGVSNTSVLRFILKAIIESYAKEFSLNRLFNIWKSMRYQASKKTFYEYFSYLEEAMFALTLRKYARSRRTSELSIPKVYLVDPGLASTIGGYQPGRAMENCVFLHLLNKITIEGGLGLGLYYWRDRSHELDFVIYDRTGSKPKALIQVTYRLDETNRDRELRPFAAFPTEQESDITRTIITWTGEEVAPDGIRVVALWKFLLE